MQQTEPLRIEDYKLNPQKIFLNLQFRILWPSLAAYPILSSWVKLGIETVNKIRDSFKPGIPTDWL